MILYLKLTMKIPPRKGQLGSFSEFIFLLILIKRKNCSVNINAYIDLNGS